MKTTVTVLGGILALSLVANTFGEVTNVYSKNAVGYLTKTIPGNQAFNLITVNMQAVNSEGMTLLDIFGTNQLAQSELSFLCDTIFVWNKDLQEYVQYAQKSTDHQFYLITDWMGSAVNPTILPGNAMWIQSASGEVDKPFSMVGSVPTTNTFSIAIPGTGFSLMGNPYPVATNLNAMINTSRGATASPLSFLCDVVFLWDIALQQYNVLGLRNDDKWCYIEDWLGESPNYSLNPGEGFWYQAMNAFDLNIVKPYSFP